MKLSTYIWLLVSAFFLIEPMPSAHANSTREAVNAGVVGILGGAPGGTYIEMAHDLATLLDDGYNFRILPSTGKGSLRAVEDLVYLRGIDMAMVQSDVLDHYSKFGRIPNLGKRLAFILKLYDEEFHLLARRGIGRIEDLRGRKVNLGPESSGTHLTGRLIFDQLGIDAQFLSDDYDVALEKLKGGEIDALVRVQGKPGALFSLPKHSGLHFLAVPSSRIRGAYQPSSLLSADYPTLIDRGRSVETIAVGAVLIAYNWPENHPRRRNVEEFVRRLHEHFDKLRAPRFHPKWAESSWDALLGWQRF